MGDQESNVAIFWDYENCAPTSSSPGYGVVDSILQIAHKYGSVKQFKAYLEISEQSSPNSSGRLRSELQSCGVSLTDCPHNGRKDVADKMMMVDMLTYAIDTTAPATLIVISGDRDFAYAISVLRCRRYRIVLVTPKSAHVSLRSRASMVVDWDAVKRSRKESPTPPISLSTDGTAIVNPLSRMPTESAVPPAIAKDTVQPRRSQRIAMRDTALMHCVDVPGLAVEITNQQAQTVQDNGDLTDPGDMRGDHGQGVKQSVQQPAESSLPQESLTSNTSAAPETADQHEPVGTSASDVGPSFQGSTMSITTPSVPNDPVPVSHTAPTPPSFIPLIRTLERFRKDGVDSPLCCLVPSLMVRNYPGAYALAGVSSWTQYVGSAVAAGIITIVGKVTKKRSRMSLKPSLGKTPAVLLSPTGPMECEAVVVDSNAVNIAHPYIHTEGLSAALTDTSPSTSNGSDGMHNDDCRVRSASPCNIRAANGDDSGQAAVSMMLSEPRHDPLPQEGRMTDMLPARTLPFAQAQDSSRDVCTLGASPRKLAIPAYYWSLMQILQKQLQAGVCCPKRDIVAQELEQRDCNVFALAGVTCWEEYAAAAAQDHVVQLDTWDGYAWITLDPAWYGRVPRAAR